MQNGAAILEDSLAVCYKTKLTLTIWSSYHIPWYLLKGVKNKPTTQNPAHGCVKAFVTIAKTWVQPRCLWVDRSIYGSPRQNEYYSVLKRNELWSHEKAQREIKTEYKLKAKDSVRLARGPGPACEVGAGFMSPRGRGPGRAWVSRPRGAWGPPTRWVSGSQGWGIRQPWDAWPGSLNIPARTFPT